MTRPHVHLGLDQGLVAGVHFPTNRISVQDFLLLLIAELGVEPLRDDWRRSWRRRAVRPRRGQPAHRASDERYPTTRK